jgi:histidinol-phosphate aminotransferase
VSDRPLPRAELRAIAAYQAGRAAPLGAVKLSSNENPFPPLPGVEAAIADAAADSNRYPDFGSERLMSALSEWLSVDRAQLTLGTGSVAVLGQLLTAMAGHGDEVIFPWRSFEAYPILVQLSGATQVRVPLRPDFTHDLDAMADSVGEQTRVALICTPNNPTGTTVTRAALEAFLDAVPPRVLVAVDEAYVEFVRDPASPDALELVGQHPNVVVLRTFSKAYGLAGLRVGYGIGAPDVMTEIRKAQLPFGITGLAERAALAALAGRAELLRRVELLVSERTRVLQALAAMGYPAPASEGNFVWLPLGDAAESFAEVCENHGVVVRSFAGDGVRVTIGEPFANDRWLEALRRFLAP